MLSLLLCSICHSPDLMWEGVTKGLNIRRQEANYRRAPSGPPMVQDPPTYKNTLIPSQGP